MLKNPDLIEVLSLFKKFGVKFLVVGGYAVMKYSEPRYTKDLDIWVDTEKENAEKVFQALKVFGAPLSGLTPEDFTQEEYFYLMGKPPFRLDVIMSIPGVKFGPAWESREEEELGGIMIPFISRDDLIKSKKACGRLQDLADAEKLEKIRPTQ